MKLAFPSLLILAAVLLGGCYEAEVMRSMPPHPSWLDTPDTARYGQLALYRVREYRKPRAIFRFPDGGKPFELAHYYEVRQVQRDGSQQVIGRLELQPVRRGDFGNLLTGGGHEWLADNHLRWWVRHGYEVSGEVRVDTSDVIVPPLPE